MSDQLLRWTTDRWGRHLEDGAALLYDVPELMQITQAHHDHIATCGIRVPSYTHVAIGSTPEQTDAVAIYTLVERIDVVSWFDPKLKEADIALTDLIHQKITAPMLQYFQWVETTNQPYRLEDLGIFTQFGLVPSPNAEHGYEGVLLDIEPLVSKRDFT